MISKLEIVSITYIILLFRLKFNLGRFQSQNLEEVNNAIDVIKSQSNVLVDILSLVKDSISKLEDQTKSYVIKVDSDEYTGPDRILIHFRMYFT